MFLVFLFHSLPDDIDNFYVSLRHRPNVLSVTIAGRIFIYFSIIIKWIFSRALMCLFIVSVLNNTKSAMAKYSILYFTSSVGDY